ncbi:MAG: hypothetical protein ACOC93_00080 [Planctomycetota bacterium]
MENNRNNPKNQPIRKFAAGPIEAAIWRNEVVYDDRVRVLLKASVSRRYKDRSGEWKTTTSFSRSDLPLVIYCLLQAFAFILRRQEEASAGGDAP